MKTFGDLKERRLELMLRDRHIVLLVERDELFQSPSVAKFVLDDHVSVLRPG